MLLNLKTENELIKGFIKYGLILLLSLSIIDKVQGQQYTEYDLKAAYIYNFSKFIVWPKNIFKTENSDFNIVVYGSSPITEVLYKALKNRKIMGRNISIKVIYSLDDLEDAHILFVSKDMQENIKEVIDACNDKAILVIGDVLEGFCQAGGLINFTPKSSKYRFEINHQVAQKSKLKISSKLLALARIISSEEIEF